MICPICNNDVTGAVCECGWRAGATHEASPPRSTYHTLPHGITREEFGEALYEVLGLIGGILQLRDWRAGLAALRAKPGQLQQWQERERTLIGQLATAMTTLSVEEAGEVVQRYPWVARC